MDEFFCSVKNDVTDGADTNLPRQLSDSSLPYQILWLLPIHCRERERGRRGGEGGEREEREEREEGKGGEGGEGGGKGVDREKERGRRGKRKRGRRERGSREREGGEGGEGGRKGGGEGGGREGGRKGGGEGGGRREQEVEGDSSLPNNQQGLGLKVPGDGVHIGLQFLRFIGSCK